MATRDRHCVRCHVALATRTVEAHDGICVREVECPDCGQAGVVRDGDRRPVGAVFQVAPGEDGRAPVEPAASALPEVVSGD